MCPVGLVFLFLCTVILLAATVSDMSDLALVGSLTNVVYICSSLYVEAVSSYGW